MEVEQRKSVSRALIYKKRYKTAYKIASEHALSAGPEFAEAEWLSGWIALSFLNSPEYAINHFENFYNNLPKQISIIKEPKINYYWYFVAEKAKTETARIDNSFFILFPLF